MQSNQSTSDIDTGKEIESMARTRNTTGDISQKRMLSEREAQTYVGLGRSATRNYCQSIGAITHIGRRILFDRYKIDKALERSGNA